jgi:hypothetical protein
MSNAIAGAEIGPEANSAAGEAPELAQSARAAAEGLAALIFQLADLRTGPQSRVRSVLIAKLDHWRAVAERPAASSEAKAEDLRAVAAEIEALVAVLPQMKDGLLPDA